MKILLSVAISSFCFSSLASAGGTPSISQVFPDSGLNTGGTRVQIKGKNLSPHSKLEFILASGLALVVSEVHFSDSKKLEFVTPPLKEDAEPGPVDLKVTDPNGESVVLSKAFRYGRILFQEDFEQCALERFDKVNTKADISLNRDPRFVHRGTASAQIHYKIPGKSPGTNSHQDSNRWLEKDFDASNGFPAGLRRLFVRASVYIKSPEPGGAEDIQRKFFYLKAPSGPKGNPNFLWGVVLTSDTVGRRIGLRLNYQSLGGVYSNALYGDDNERGSKPNTVNGIAELAFDTWNTVEIEIGAKSALGANDSVLRLWVNGSLVFEKTKTWTTRVSCRAGGTVSCPPFPDDAVFGNGITRIELGTQVDRLQYVPVDEFRYLDDIVIADAFVEP